MMRLTDIFLAIPYIVLAVAIATVFGRSENSVILVLGLTGWLPIAAIVRASFLGLKKLEYVEAARALGFSRTTDHVPPHPAQRHPADHRLRHDRVGGGDPVRGGAVVPRRRSAVADAGVGPDGRRAAQGSLDHAPHLLFFPGLAIFLTVLGLRVRRRRPARRPRPEAEVTDADRRTPTDARPRDRRRAAVGAGPAHDVQHRRRRR